MPEGVTAAGGENDAPYADIGDFTTCAEFIDAYKFVDAGSAECGFGDVVELSCCFNAPENPCITCPDGITATGGDDFAPYADSGDLRTCAELVDLAMLFESGSYMCGYSEIDELSCCPTVPEDPCIICPNGATAGNDFIPYAEEGGTTSCSDLIEGVSLFETGSSFCGVQGDMYESYCCSTASITVAPTPTVVVTPAPTPMPEDDTTVATTTTSSTMAPEVKDPCIICPNGITAGDDFVPNASSGNSMTCLELINSSMDYESGSQMCSFSSLYKTSCCPTTTAPASEDNVLNALPTKTPTEIPTIAPTEIPTFDAMTPAPTPAPADDTTVATTTTMSTLDTDTGVDDTCIICPDGTDAAVYAPYADDGDSRTCADLIDEAKLHETGSDECGYSELHELHCCYTAPEKPCIICPDGATAGDDYVPEYEGNSEAFLTCKELIDGAKRFESESDACGLYDIDVAYCCPYEVSPAPISTPMDDTTVATTTTSSTSTPEVDNPCIICPNGATAGYDDFQPFAGAGETKTCKELLDGMINVAGQAGSDLCVSMSEIEALCCLDVDPSPSPVEPSPESPDSGIMTESPTVPSSGGASVSGLVGFASIYFVSALCVIACM